MIDTTRLDVIFDLDGTICDLTHRRHHVATKPKNWPAFFAGVKDDQPIAPIVAMLHRMSICDRIILCSGRQEQLRPVTEEWLNRHVWGDDKGRVAFSKHAALYMRADGDYRSDDIVKEELLDRIIADGFNPKLVFDDRDRVVAMWRRRGLVCCQVAEGAF